MLNQEHCQGGVGSLPLNIDFSQYLTITAISVLNNFYWLSVKSSWSAYLTERSSFLPVQEGVAEGCAVRGMEIQALWGFSFYFLLMPFL